MDKREIDLRFTYHPPVGDQADRYQTIRNAAKRMAMTIRKQTPESREQSLAITHLEEAVFWANAAIARREEFVEDGEDVESTSD
jgi:hypothetical protein